MVDHGKGCGVEEEELKIGKQRWLMSDCVPYRSIQHQLVKDKGAQIFYNIQSQTKPIGIGANCEIPHNPSLTMRFQQLEPMTGL